MIEVDACPLPVYTGLIAVGPYPPDDATVPGVAVAAVRTPTTHLEYAAAASSFVSAAAVLFKLPD